MSQTIASRFDVSSLPIVSTGWAPAPAAVPARVVADPPRFARAIEWAEWAYDLGLDGAPMDLPASLGHSFFQAATGGYVAGRAQAARDAREARDAGAFLLGQAFGLAGVSPRMPANYDAAEIANFSDGWMAGDAERADREPTPEDYAALNGSDHDAQPDPNDVYALSISESEWHEISEGFVCYPDEETVRAWGVRAATIEG